MWYGGGVVGDYRSLHLSRVRNETLLNKEI
jgi:hypothetical protein